MAAVLDAGRHGVASHASAAWLWGIPGFSARRPEVSRARGGTRQPSSLAIVHEPRFLPDAHVTVFDGIPVTTPERTLCDIAGQVRPQRAERAVDSALARGTAGLPRLWLTYGDLTARGRPGRAAMGFILAERQPGYIAPESELEDRFLRIVARAGLAPPERQVALGGLDLVGRVDCLFRPARLVVELDGRLGHASLLDQKADARRDAALRAAGFEVLRFGWIDVVVHPHRMLAQLGRVLAQRAAA